MSDVDFKGAIFDTSKYKQTTIKILRRVVPEAVKLYKANAPVDTGFLESQIQKLDFYTIGFLAPYSSYVNDGTRRQKGQHFIEGTEGEVTKLLEFFTEKYFKEELT